MRVGEDGTPAARVLEGRGRERVETLEVLVVLVRGTEEPRNVIRLGRDWLLVVLAGREAPVEPLLMVRKLPLEEEGWAVEPLRLRVVLPMMRTVGRAAELCGVLLVEAAVVGVTVPEEVGGVVGPLTVGVFEGLVGALLEG